MRRLSTCLVAILCLFSMPAFAEERVIDAEVAPSESAEVEAPTGEADGDEPTHPGSGEVGAQVDNEGEEQNAPETPTDARSGASEGAELENRRLVLRSVMHEIGPHLAGCFESEHAARQSVLYLRASEGSIRLERAEPTLEYRTLRCVASILSGLHLNQPEGEVLELQFALGEQEELRGLGIGPNSSRRRRIGIALTVIGSILLVGGLAAVLPLLGDDLGPIGLTFMPIPIAGIGLLIPGATMLRRSQRNYYDFN